MSEHASALIRHKRDARDGGCDARREPRRKVRQRLDPNVCCVARIEHIENGANDNVILRR